MINITKKIVKAVVLVMVIALWFAAMSYTIQHTILNR
jgi:hypothetical protein